MEDTQGNTQGLIPGLTQGTRGNAQGLIFGLIEGTRGDTQGLVLGLIGGTQGGTQGLIIGLIGGIQGDTQGLILGLIEGTHGHLPHPLPPRADSRMHVLPTEKVGTTFFPKAGCLTVDQAILISPTGCARRQSG